MELFKNLLYSAIKEAKEYFIEKESTVEHTTVYEIEDWIKTNEPKILSELYRLNLQKESVTSRVFFYSAMKTLRDYEILDSKFNTLFTFALVNYVYPEWDLELGGCWYYNERLLKFAQKFKNMYFCKEKNIKVFISLPFTGVEETIGERFEETKQFALNNLTFDDSNVETVAQDNIYDLIETKKSSDDYPYDMGKDIEKVLRSDYIVMGIGWKNSKGCQLEHKAADLFGVKIIEMDGYE